MQALCQADATKKGVLITPPLPVASGMAVCAHVLAPECITLVSGMVLCLCVFSMTVEEQSLMQSFHVHADHGEMMVPAQGDHIGPFAHPRFHAMRALKLDGH